MNFPATPTTQRMHRRRRSRRGATAIEFALVAPTFLIVIAVCAEFARMSMMRNLAQNAAYEASRFVMTEGCTVADGINRAEEILSRVGTVGAIVLINGSDGSVNTETGQVNSELQRNTQTITCTVEILLKDNSLIIPDIVFGDAKISASMTLRAERYRGYYEAGSAD